LPHHPRRGDIRAVLVESDPRNVGVARRAAAREGLSQVEVRQADASLVASFADALPADVLLLCGIFGNLSDRDIKRTVEAAPALCQVGATVIWTRHRRPPDLTPQVRAWFTDSGFDEVAFDALGTSTLTGVGVHRLRRARWPSCLASRYSPFIPPESAGPENAARGAFCGCEATESSRTR
jgi:hypothetical protein